MMKLGWSRMVAVVTFSMFASATVSAQTVQRVAPQPTFGVPDVRPSTSRGPEARVQPAGVHPHSNEIVRLPPIGPPALPTVPPATSVRNNVPDVSRKGNGGAEGTWSEEGRFLIININGQEMRLVRADSQTPSNSALPEDHGGAVHGRLSHAGQPLANCEIAIVPLQKDWTGYKLSPSGERMARTDGNGTYSLRNVPAGPYKMRWRPAGESSWIRRAEVRPDVHVRANETTQVKEIRVAMRTIN